MGYKTYDAVNLGDEIAIDNVWYVVLRRGISGLLLEEASDPKQHYSFYWGNILLSQSDYDKYMYEGRIKFRDKEGVKGSCSHSWSRYTGATKIDMFCMLCGAVKEIHWYEIGTDTKKTDRGY